MMENRKEFYLEEDGIRLHAELDLPRGRETCPLVILFHGLSGHMEEEHLTAAAEAMNECGFAVLRTDQYGHGQSDGRFEDHTILKWIGNAMTFITYAESLDFVSELYLCGHSQGGLLAMIAAGMRPDDISGLIAMSPAVNIPSGAREGNFLDILHFDPRHIPKMLAFDEYRLKGDYFRTAQLIHTEDAVKRFAGRVLVIHGDADEIVPVQYGIDTAAGYENGRLVILQGADHDYHGHLEEMSKAIQAFLREAGTV